MINIDSVCNSIEEEWHLNKDISFDIDNLEITLIKTEDDEFRVFTYSGNVTNDLKIYLDEVADIDIDIEDAFDIVNDISEMID